MPTVCYPHDVRIRGEREAVRYTNSCWSKTSTRVDIHDYYLQQSTKKSGGVCPMQLNQLRSYTVWLESKVWDYKNKSLAHGDFIWRGRTQTCAGMVFFAMRAKWKGLHLQRSSKSKGLQVVVLSWDAVKEVEGRHADRTGAGVRTGTVVGHNLETERKSL